MRRPGPRFEQQYRRAAASSYGIPRTLTGVQSEPDQVRAASGLSPRRFRDRCGRRTRTHGCLRRALPPPAGIRKTPRRPPDFGRGKPSPPSWSWATSFLGELSSAGVPAARDALKHHRERKTAAPSASRSTPTVRVDRGAYRTGFLPLLSVGFEGRRPVCTRPARTWTRGAWPDRTGPLVQAWPGPWPGRQQQLSREGQPLEGTGGGDVSLCRSSTSSSLCPASSSVRMQRAARRSSATSPPASA